MKVNKKAILGMLVAMVMSLGIMGSFNKKTEDNNSNLQQLTAYALHKTATSETNGGTTAWGIIATAGVGVTKVGVKTTIATGWCPLGWVAGACTVVAAG